MGKNILYPFFINPKVNDQSELKKLSLVYENIYIHKYRINVLNSNLRIDSILNSSSYEDLIELSSTLDFLIDKNIIKEYNFSNDKSLTNNDSQILIERNQIKELIYRKEKNLRIFKKNISSEESQKYQDDLNKLYLISSDYDLRLDTINLRNLNEINEFYPYLMNSMSLFNEKEKKQTVIQFILNDIPTPDNSVSWEHIIEYRSDEDIKNKYLTLLNWINKISNSNLKLSEIKEEYDYLFSEYKKQFKLHKMKFNNSKIEIIINASVNFLSNIGTGNYTTSLKDIFQFNLKNAQLLQEESKLPGKEIAYIYHTVNKFK